MKFRCIYCTHTFDSPERPAACPNCATPFTLTVTQGTPIFDIAMALERNGHELNFTLRARLPETHTERVDVTLAAGPDTESRAPGCRCHIEPGDSRCPAHSEDSP